jgi:SAM-dependent methyltransferase
MDMGLQIGSEGSSVLKNQSGCEDQSSTSDEPYWGEISQALMQRVLECAFVVGWRAAVESLVSPDYPHLTDYIQDARRTTGLGLLCLEPGNIVLDVGCGYGCLTEGLARLGASVIATDSVVERVKFTELRCSQEGLSTVRCLHGEFMDIELGRASLDAVVMNGVLEWLPLAHPELRPDRLQLAALRRAHSFLKTGGELYLAIENRLSASILRGGTDHSGLPYTSLMPRLVANWWCKHQAKLYRSPANIGYRTYTYTIWGYKGMLRRAGFARVQAYWPIPGYNQPYELVPLDDTATLRYWELNSAPGRRWRLARRLLPWLPPTYLAALAASDVILIATRG